MPNMQNIGQALSGFGAGLTGQGQQFQRNQLLERQIGQEDDQRRRLMAAERQKTLFTDAEGALRMVNAGRYDQAAQLFGNRLQDLQSFPEADPKDTGRMFELAQRATQGDQQAMQSLKYELENGVSVGRAYGLLDSKQLTGVSDQGQIFFNGPNGPEAQNVTGFIGGDEGGAASISPASPKDFTVKSMALYAESGNIGDLERYTPQVKEIAGIPHQYNPGSLKWEPLVDMRGSGISEQHKAAADLAADSASRVEFGKQKIKWEGSQDQVFSAIGAGEEKQIVMTNTIAKVKELIGGWTTTYGASLSDIPGTDARMLKGLLDTLKANSAFTTLTSLKASGGTLGAISEAELNLLERAFGAIDQGGDSTELLRVIDQIGQQNTGSLQRLRSGHAMNKKRYSGTYDETQSQVRAENTFTWDSL